MCFLPHALNEDLLQPTKPLKPQHTNGRGEPGTTKSLKHGPEEEFAHFTEMFIPAYSSSCVVSEVRGDLSAEAGADDVDGGRVDGEGRRPQQLHQVERVFPHETTGGQIGFCKFVNYELYQSKS